MNKLNIGNILKVIFKTINKKGNILADLYLIKDSSIISKWKSCRSKPTNEDLSKIVEFTYEESSEMQRKIIRNEIEGLIFSSEIRTAIKTSLIGITDFKEFLSEVLNVATAPKDIVEDKKNKLVENCHESESNKWYQSKNDNNGFDIKADFFDAKENTSSGIVEFDVVLDNYSAQKDTFRCRGTGKFNLAIIKGHL